MPLPQMTVFFADDHPEIISGSYHTYEDREPITALCIMSKQVHMSLHLADPAAMIALGERIAAEGRRLQDEAEQAEHAQAVAAYLEECGADPDMDNFEVAR